MSAKIQILTPFVDKELLLKSLDRLGINYRTSQEANNISLSNGVNFIWKDLKYEASYYTENRSLLEKIETMYNELAEKKKYLIKKLDKFNDLNINELEKLKLIADDLELLEIKRKIEDAITEIKHKKLAEEAYSKLLEEKLKKEQELQRLKEQQEAEEQKLKEYIDETIKKITENAKKQGYSIKQKKVGNKIKLILRRNV